MTTSLFYVGTCNRALPYFATANGVGIAGFRLDEATGVAAPVRVTEGIDNPTFLAIDPSGRTLCATSEVLGWNEGTISAYAVDAATGGLSYVNKQPTRGDIAAHLSFSPDGAFAASVNYGVVAITERPNRSVVVYPLSAEGELGAPSAQVTHTGAGPVAPRQDRPHAHCVRWTPDGRFVLVADLGIDQLVIYGFDAAAGSLTPRGAVALPPGSGPRHFCFHPSRPMLYCVNEIASTVTTLRFDEGVLTVAATQPTVPASALEHNHCSGIQIAPDGGNLYVGNRGHDSIGHFRIGADGVANFAQTLPCGGKTPRDLAFSPSGEILAVANQDSDVVAFFSYAPDSGMLAEHGSVAAGTPTAIAFHPGAN